MPNIVTTPYLLKNGFYQVGGSIFPNKLMAVMHGTRYNEHPKWCFNEDRFKSVNWTIEPQESLTELYQRRARDLREKHDYVILMFSGGIDSTTALYSFLDQGLKVDEIVTTWSVMAAEKYHGEYTDRSPENCISEWVYCTKPALSKISTMYPDIKITVVDSTEDICKDVYHEEDFFLFDSFHNLPGMNRWSVFLKKIRNICQQHHNHVVVVGLDKPFHSIVNDTFNLYFLDVSLFIKSDHEMNVEYFFWNPDASDILRKQSHVIFKYFQENPDKRKMLLRERDDDLLALINSLIYPYYNPQVFQARKQTYMIYNDQQKWAWKLSQYQDGVYVDRWLSHWKNFLLEIDPKYIRYKHNLFDGLVGFTTPGYYIGTFK